MKYDAVSDFLVYNGLIRPTADRQIFSEITGRSIYEVIKLIDGIPLFFEDHMERMKQSALHMDVDLRKPSEDIRSEIALLVEKNRLSNINVKLVFTEKGTQQEFLTYFIRQYFPDKNDYLNGARTILYSGERKDPHVKTVGSSFRDRVRSLREAVGAYEALLVNEYGHISEGTRTNIFFLVHDQLYTSPSAEVLLGVTRRNVLNVCRRLKISVKERLLHQNDLQHLQGAFITGTTIDVLPIAYIDDLYLASVRQPVIVKIAEEFAAEVTNYIRMRTPNPSDRPQKTQNRN